MNPWRGMRVGWVIYCMLLGAVLGLGLVTKNTQWWQVSILGAVTTTSCFLWGWNEHRYYLWRSKDES